MFYSSKQKGTRTLAIAKAIVMADMLLIMFFFHISMIFEKGVCTFKKLSTLIVQTPFPTLQKDPMNKKQNLIAKRWESSNEEAESEEVF